MAREIQSPWVNEYRRRVGFVMDIAAEDEQRTVLWIGQPPMRGRALTHGCSYSTSCIKSKQTQENSVHYIDLRSLFTDASGEYSSTFPTQTENSGCAFGRRRAPESLGREWLSELLLSEISRLSDLGDLWSNELQVGLCARNGDLHNLDISWLECS